jgi:DNA polymerase-4
VARRLRRDRVAARTVVLKVKLGARRRANPADGWRGPARLYPILTRRATLGEATDDGALLGREARRLLERMPLDPIRLVGVGATNLIDVDASQPSLFEPARERRRSVRLNRALDEIVERFGTRAVVRAGQEEGSRAGLSLQRKRGERDPGAPDSKR